MKLHVMCLFLSHAVESLPYPQTERIFLFYFQALEAVLSGLADSHVKVGHRLALYLRGKGICERPHLKLGHRLKECYHTPLKDLPKVRPKIFCNIFKLDMISFMWQLQSSVSVIIIITATDANTCM